MLQQVLLNRFDSVPQLRGILILTPSGGLEHLFLEGLEQFLLPLRILRNDDTVRRSALANRLLNRGILERDLRILPAEERRDEE